MLVTCRLLQAAVVACSFSPQLSTKCLAARRPRSTYPGSTETSLSSSTVSLSTIRRQARRHAVAALPSASEDWCGHVNFRGVPVHISLT